MSYRGLVDARRWAALSLLGFLACEAQNGTAEEMSNEVPMDEAGSLTGADCDYPDGAVEPMMLGEVLAPYNWAEALHADGRSAGLNLAEAACGTDAIIEWSPHDVLLFVSIPAW